MVEQIIIGGAVAVTAATAAYVYFTKTYLDPESEVDDDNDDLPYSFEGSNAAQTPEEDPRDTNADVEEQADPTPEVVSEKEDVTQITGIGPTRGQSLADAGFETPEDIYYASDANLDDVYGIGPHAISNIRSDIGSVGDNKADEE